MTRFLKDLIEQNVDLIDTNNWRQLFIEAYNEALTTAEVLELHNMLLEAGIVDSTQIRNDLLYEYISENINFVRDKYLKNAADPNDMKISDSYAAQFLRTYLNNTFGFTELEALNFMWDTQKSLGIKLSINDRKAGQLSIVNYRIHYDGLS